MMRFEQVRTELQYGIYYSEDKHAGWAMQWYKTEEEMDEAVKKIQENGRLLVTEENKPDKMVPVRAFLRIGGDGTYWRYPSPKAVAQ